MAALTSTTRTITATALHHYRGLNWGLAMDGEIEIVSDGDGFAIIGESAAVDRFVRDEGLSSRDFGLPRLQRMLTATGAAAQAGGEIAANAGRWVKLTPESAAALKKFEAMKGSTADVSRAIMMNKGKTAHILEFTKTPGSMLTNPALLTGAAGMLTQLAMQQAMDEIADHLAAIDEKVDDILRRQTNAVVSQLVGAGHVVDDAMVMREQAGVVNDATWSKVQGVAATIGTVRAYALSELEAIADKLLTKSSIGELASVSKDSTSQIYEWLTVLARSLQLEDAVAILELDRVLYSDPDEVEPHRLGLREARARRRKQIAYDVGELLTRVHNVAAHASENVLTHPSNARSVARSSQASADSINDFRECVGLTARRRDVPSKRWIEAVSDVKDRAVDAGSAGATVVKGQGSRAVDRGRVATNKVADLAKRVRTSGGRDTE